MSLTVDQLFITDRLVLHPQSTNFWFRPGSSLGYVFTSDSRGFASWQPIGTNSGLTPGSVIFAGGNGALVQDNANFFWDSTNHRLGLFTNTPGFPVDSETSLTQGEAWRINHTQTQANAADQGDTALALYYTVSASTATNELVATGFAANVTNSLTGGGHVQSMRSFIVIHYTNAGTTTDLWDVFSVDVGNAGGSVTQMTGFHILNLQGTTQVGVQVNTLSGTNWVAFLEGTSAPSGTWGVYITDNQPSFFGGWVRQTQGPARITADVPNSTTTFTNLTDLTVSNLVAGRSYFGRVTIKANNSVAAEGIKFDWNGGSATMTSFWSSVKQVAGAAATLGTDISTSLTGVLNYTAMGSAADIVLEFQVSFTVANTGSLDLRFAENSHATGTATVRLGSFILLGDSPN